MSVHASYIYHLKLSSINFVLDPPLHGALAGGGKESEIGKMTPPPYQEKASYSLSSTESDFIFKLNESKNMSKMIWGKCKFPRGKNTSKEKSLFTAVQWNRGRKSDKRRIRVYQESILVSERTSLKNTCSVCNLFGRERQKTTCPN